jgi:hypothetical protein
MMAVLNGYQARKSDQWNQTRILAWVVAATVTEPDKRGEIYDMFYIPGDPTPEEREQRLAEEMKEWRQRQKELTDQVRAEKMAENNK